MSKCLKEGKKMSETIGVAMLLSTYKKVMSLHKQYDDASDVIDDAINALTRGPTLKDFIDFLDILKNVVRGHGLTVDGWIELMEESYSEEELKKIRILDAIHTLEWRDENHNKRDKITMETEQLERYIIFWESYLSKKCGWEKYVFFTDTLNLKDIEKAIGKDNRLYYNSSAKVYKTKKVKKPLFPDLEQDLMEEERRGRRMQIKVGYDPDSSLLVSTNPEERESAGWLGKYRSDPRRAPKLEWTEEKEEMKRCSNCGAAFQEWIRPEPQNPDTIALLKSIELLGTGVRYPPHVCPNCKHYWWTYEDQMEDEQWPDDW